MEGSSILYLALGSIWKRAKRIKTVFHLTGAGHFGLVPRGNGSKIPRKTAQIDRYFCFEALTFGGRRPLTFRISARGI